MMDNAAGLLGHTHALARHFSEALSLLEGVVGRGRHGAVAQLARPALR